jgi:hypothetical protein
MSPPPADEMHHNFSLSHWERVGVRANPGVGE